MRFTGSWSHLSNLLPNPCSHLCSLPHWHGQDLFHAAWADGVAQPYTIPFDNNTGTCILTIHPFVQASPMPLYQWDTGMIQKVGIKSWIFDKQIDLVDP